MRSSFCAVRILALGAAVVVLLAMASPSCLSQDTARQVVVDERTFNELLARLDRLETRVKELESEKAHPATVEAQQQTTALKPASALGPPSPSLVASNSAVAAQQTQPDPHAQSDAENEQAENLMERMDVSKTLLRIRGFGDVSLHGDTGKGDSTSFSLGQLDLFVTSDVSDRFRFLSEIVFEAGPDNIYGVRTGEENAFSVDIERYLIQYSRNDYFNLSVGRGHTAIGYYNNAYHHSSWLQTATGRPFLFEFEDRGGILPIHMVGASASGQIRSGRLGLHYVAEVGNGRASRQPLQENAVQNAFDDQNHKAYNLALFSRPEAVHGLQAGFSFYRDMLDPLNQPRIAESILAGHAVLIRPRYEWLNEALVDRHTVKGTQRVYNTPGFYTQLSRQWGAYRPYMRYQYLNASPNEPVFPDIGLQHGPSFGVRYDASESVALKFQYDYTMARKLPPVNALNMQLGFTF